MQCPAAYWQSYFPNFHRLKPSILSCFFDSPNGFKMARITLPFTQNQKCGFSRYELEKLRQTHHFALGQAGFAQA